MKFTVAFILTKHVYERINKSLLPEFQKMNGEVSMMIINIKGRQAAFVPCERLASAIANILEKKEECFPSDISTDFSDMDIERHWCMAYALAQVERMESA